MSADVINDNYEPVIWTVHGVNWSVNIPLDEYNTSFDEETQMFEAASIATYVFKGEDRGVFLTLDEGEEEPLLGPTMIVHLRRKDPAKYGKILFTHEVLANCGFYNDSKQMAKVLQDSLEEMEANSLKDKEIDKNINESVAKLKKSLNPKKAK